MSRNPRYAWKIRKKTVFLLFSYAEKLPTIPMKITDDGAESSNYLRYILQQYGMHLFSWRAPRSEEYSVANVWRVVLYDVELCLASPRQPISVLEPPSQLLPLISLHLAPNTTAEAVENLAVPKDNKQCSYGQRLFRGDDYTRQIDEVLCLRYIELRIYGWAYVHVDNGSCIVARKCSLTRRWSVARGVGV